MRFFSASISKGRNFEVTNKNSAHLFTFDCSAVDSHGLGGLLAAPGYRRGQDL